MNNTQERILSIYKEFQKVCKQLNLKYCGFGGTALGAIRHQGFIPWDDDMDVAMPREDYEKFLKEGQKLLPKNLFIQNILTDPQCIIPFTKIRDTNTSNFIDSDFLGKGNIVHGLFLDVFPLDGICESMFKRKLLDKKFLMYYYRISSHYFDNYQNTSKKQRFISRLLCPSFKHAVKGMLNIQKKYEFGTTRLCLHGYYQGRVRAYRLTEWFLETTDVNFEDTTLPVPKNYDAYLTGTFGNWRVPVKEISFDHFGK